MKTRRLILLSIFLAQALVLSYIEAQVPYFTGIAGFKPGLSNIIILICLAYLGLRNTFIMVTSKCILTSVFIGAPVSFLYGYTGGLLSLFSMYLLYKYFKKYLSFLGISVAGAVMHNIGQLLAAVILVDKSVIHLLPVLIFFGLVTGTITGICCQLLTKYIPESYFLGSSI